MHVLVVDDEVSLAEAVKDGLVAEGFTVEVCYDGLTGLAKAKTGSFDAVVLDLLLPGMNGYNVCRELRDSGVATPVLMLTAKSGEYDEADGFEMGADDYLTKPFSFVVLTARLRALSRRVQKVAAAELSAGGLVLEPVERRCARDGTEVSLTSREASVLEVLMRAEGRVVAKEELRRQVWGPDATDDNVVEVYVGYLRRKIDAPFGISSIETVRGLGYRLVPR